MSKFALRLFNTVEPVTTFYRDLIPYWEAQGWQVDVVISRALYRAGRDEAWRSPQTEVHHTPSFGLQAQGRWAKLVIMLAYIIFAAGYSLFAPSVQRNVFLTQPPLFFVWGYVLQQLRRQPYYIVLMDLYPDVAIRDGVLSTHSPITTLLLKLSRLGLRRADGVIVIGRCMRERVIALGVQPDRVHFIPNWTDENKVQPLPHEANTFRLEHGWQDKFVVLYSGNIGTSHFFDDILEVCCRLQPRHDLLFAFIGQGRRRKEIEQFKQQHNLDNIQMLPFQPQDKLALSLSAGDIHFVSLRPGFEGLVVPSKAYGILAAGRPVLYQGEANGEIAQMITEETAGSVAPLSDANALEAAILKYVNNPDLAKKQGGNARQAATGKYSKQSACAQYTTVLSTNPRKEH